MSDTEPTARRSARTLLVDQDDRILLLRFRFDRDDRDDWPAEFGWCTPGGGVNDGEPLHVAAARELFEETGVRADPDELVGPVALIAGYADLGFAEGIFRDDFFFHRTAARDIDTSRMEELESSYHAGHRWWSVPELESTSEYVVPIGLVGLLRDLLAGRIPDDPVRLPWHH